MARLKKIAPLSDLAPAVLKKADRAGHRYGVMAVEAWPVVVGEEINRHTRGFALRDNHELVVFVDSGAWANQLTLMADDLQVRLNAHIGKNAVNSLRFTVSRKVAERRAEETMQATTDAFYTPDTMSPAPLDTIELEQARHVATAIGDPALRELALRVMVKDLEQKKGARLKRASVHREDTTQQT